MRTKSFLSTFVALLVAALVPAVSAAEPSADALNARASGTFSNAVGPAGSNPNPLYCGGQGQTTCASRGLTGPPTQVRWGQLVSAGQRSGLGFGPSATQTIEPGQEFVLGALTHFNFPVAGGTGATSAKLTVRLRVADLLDASLLDTDAPVNFAIDETVNTPPCTYQSTTPCADRVGLAGLAGNSYEVTSGDTVYILDILGFREGTTATSPATTAFISDEGGSKTAYLWAKLSLRPLRDQTIAWDEALPTRTYGDAPFDLQGGSASSALPVIYDGSGSCSVSGRRVTLTAAGTCTLRASQAGSRSYRPAATVERTFEVSKARPTVSADSRTVTYDRERHAVSGSVAGVDGEDLGTPSFTYGGSSEPPRDAGSYPVVASFAGNANYEAATDEDATLTIERAPLRVAAADDERVYGDPNPEFRGQLTGVLGDDVITASYATDATLTSDVASYEIVPSLDDPDGRLGNYAVEKIDGALTVTMAPLTVAADDKTRAFGRPNPELTGTLTGVRNDDPITASYRTDATETSPLGAYEIVPGLAPEDRLSNYEVDSRNGVLTVRDETDPTVRITTPANESVFRIGQEVSADFECSDPEGATSCEGELSEGNTTTPISDGDTIRTSSPGQRTLTATARDGAGHVTQVVHRFRIGYDFSGFMWPVNSWPTVNSVRAGSIVPVPFRLGGDQGLDVLATGSPSSKQIACSATAGEPDAVEKTLNAVPASISQNGLVYLSRLDRYVYAWKTQTKWAGTCRSFVLRLNDGSVAHARFRFTRGDDD